MIGVLYILHLFTIESLRGELTDGIRRRGLADMINAAEKRGQLIRLLEEALALADELQDGPTGYLIERALDEARSNQFKPMG